VSLGSLWLISVLLTLSYHSLTGCFFIVKTEYVTFSNIALVSPTERVAFVQASQSRQSVQQLMPEAQVQSLVVYDNTPAKDIPSGKYDILVFTSPMNVEVFFQDRNFNEEVIIAIGPTTGSKLAELEIAQVQIPEYPTEESILVLLKQFI